MLTILKSDFFQLNFLQKLAHFYCIKTYRIYQSLTLLKLDKRQYLPHYGSDKDCKGTVVNQALASLHGGSHGIKLMITLSMIKINNWLIDWFRCNGVNADTLVRMDRGICVRSFQTCKKEEDLVTGIIVFRGIFQRCMTWDISNCEFCQIK